MPKDISLATTSLSIRQSLEPAKEQKEQAQRDNYH